MKTFIKLPYIAIISIIFFLSSCSKINSEAPENTEYEATYELSTNQAIADNTTEDANSILMEAAATKNLLGGNIYNLQTISSNLLKGSNIQVTPLVGFPKTITVNFGTTGLLSVNGKIRKGKITIVLTDSVKKSGSKATINFTDYSINNINKEGTVIWKNTSTNIATSWQRTIENGIITTPDGKYWKHSGVLYAVQMDGSATPNNLLDDMFLVTGNQTITNNAGIKRDCFITEALSIKANCGNIVSGKLNVKSNSHNALIDFGNGVCDNIVTISINGRPEKIINL